LNRTRIVARLLSGVAIAVLIVIAASVLIRRNGTAIRIRPPPAWTPSGPGTDEASPQLTLDAPRERDDIDAGVADAARNFASRILPPHLKVPESAEFPADAIRFERLALLNQTTGGRIEHWFVNGAVDAQNEYGSVVRSPWRILLARAEDRFFPVMVQLGDFEVHRRRGHVEMLAEARRAAWQEREAQAAAQKTNELAASRAVWKANAAARPADEKARAALKLALDLLAAGREGPARRRLQDVIDNFPGTSAAAEAEEELNNREK
jgi:hypothetical protein